MDIAEIALQVLIESNLVATENIAIGRIKNSNWDGNPRIIIIDGENNLIEHQLGVVAQETRLTIYCIHQDRNQSKELCSQASEIVYAKFKSMSNKNDSGILAIARESTGVNSVGDRPEFEAFQSVNITNCRF
jgi:hypothetical protein